MEKLKFKKEINASAEKVWEVLLGVSTYPLWTAVFAAGSTVETDWKKGSKAYFSDGKGHGMVSRIEENIPNQFISIKHLGEFKDGKEDLNKDWGEAFENYTLETVEGKTLLTIDLQISKDWVDYMEKTWPAALEKVAELAE
ncbi:SRPBCC domain-containing protein [Pedobacter sp. Leaf194]|uniref:SRPBCC domain-containing protein n=1 Tax=Pedobacter sp. Leaf194 TaxID=1736297 RepID=UPI0007030B3D|nr:SRPBCC domain-containing protein [Pedobacter sp. Leaf194]KQS36413.1 ATPase [Pedobacter sp. Leaf194]